MAPLDVDRALARWMPRLVAVWRRHRRLPEGPPTLVGRELKDVAHGIRTLSAGLTRDRALVGGRYLDDPKLLGAYLLFYWPVSYAQARAVLGELPRRPRTVLDLGSGPAPVAFAALDAGASEVTAADRSAPALTLARALAAEAEEPLATRTWTGGAALPEGQFDAITLGHVLNELGRGPAAITERAALLERAAGQVRPGGSLVVLEPALRDTSRELLHVRDLLVQRGFAVRAPCLWRGACPALVKASDWCHAERSWSPPPLAGRAGAGGGAAQGGAEDELPRARATGRGVGRAAGREGVPDRVRAARGEGAPAVHGVRAGGADWPRAAGEAPDGIQRGLLLAPPRGRGGGGGNRAARRRARAGRGELAAEGGVGRAGVSAPAPEG